MFCGQSFEDLGVRRPAKHIYPEKYPRQSGARSGPDRNERSRDVFLSVMKLV